VELVVPAFDPSNPSLMLHTIMVIIEQKIEQYKTIPDKPSVVTNPFLHPDQLFKPQIIILYEHLTLTVKYKDIVITRIAFPAAGFVRQRREDDSSGSYIVAQFLPYLSTGVQHYNSEIEWESFRKLETKYNNSVFTNTNPTIESVAFSAMIEAEMEILRDTALLKDKRVRYIRKLQNLYIALCRRIEEWFMRTKEEQFKSTIIPNNNPLLKRANSTDSGPPTVESIMKKVPRIENTI
jgi:hypothetical protein